MGELTQTATVTQQETVVQPYIRFDPEYTRTIPGIVKIACIVLNLIGFICIEFSYFSYRPQGSFFNTIAMLGFWFSGIMLVFYLFHVCEKFHKIPWLKIELYFCAAWTLLYMIAASVAAATSIGAFQAAAFFGYCAMVGYGVDAFLKFQAVRAGEIAQGSRTVHISCHTDTSRHPASGALQLHRMISSSEVATALRPFYFAVHPDLFGRYPQQRQVNEDSLKLLSAHLESLLSQQRILPSTPRSLPFYVRASNAPQDRGTFNLIKVPLERTVDAKVLLRRILESCNLPTEYVDKMPSTKNSTAPPSGTHPEGFQQQQQNSFYYRKRSEYNFGKEQADDDDSPFEKEFDLFQFRIKKVRENETLKKWLRKHVVTATVRTKAVQELQEEVQKLREDVTKQLGLREIIYDCGWNVEHFRGCLKSLEKLAELHPGALDGLKDRTLVFAAFTGVSLEGHVMLFTGDVQRNWLELIKTIDKHDSYLRKLPAYEYALSQVLRNIRIGRRKFMPKAQAMAYASHLRKITTALLDYLGRSKFPKSWPQDLSQFELVVESEAGPLMVSPTGQLIVPATCPGSLLVDFLTNHLAEALDKQNSYDRQKHIERDLHARCVAQFRLLTLTKDDSVTPDRMIECLEKLLLQGATGLELADLNLTVTTYYSVLTDGTVCIPWDWKH
uniref:Uncharacterized protein n=1 Tax=Anopheles atroparvus TaxID=41427 RepID=A0A182JF51_ANOAO